jgi:murein DD-endopeptidase MepM/ murein hydrolase activator NlpD
VRSFPSAIRRRLLTSALVGGLAVAVLALPFDVALTSSPPAAADDLRDKQRDVRQQIEQAQEEVQEASRGVAAATAAFETAKAELASAKAVLAGARSNVMAVRVRLRAAKLEDARMQAALDTAQTRLEEARADVVAGQRALDAQREVVTETVVGIYQQGSPELLALTGYLTAKTPADLTRRLEYTDTLVEDEASAFDDLHAAEVLLKVRATEVKAAEERVAAQRKDAAEHYLKTLDLYEEAEAAKVAADAARVAVQDKVERRRETRAAAWAARRHDLAVLARLKKEEQRIKQQILAAAAADKGPGYVGSSDGFLLAPVAGPVTSPFGYRIHPIYGYWGLHDGTDFGAGCGSALRASAAGTVISSYYSSVYGNRLYVNVGKVNGHNLTIVYNHATGYRVGVGAHVDRGQTVGYVGSTGWSTGCHLHFTVLRDGNPVDPMGYL